MSLLNTTYFAHYKNRIPNPGNCEILVIDWEKKSLVMSNGRCTYFPSFDEVEMTKNITNKKNERYTINSKKRIKTV